MRYTTTDGKVYEFETSCPYCEMTTGGHVPGCRNEVVGYRADGTPIRRYEQLMDDVMQRHGNALRELARH